MAKGPRITVLQPDSHCPLDRFENWLGGAGLRMTHIPLGEKDLPAPETLGEGLLVLGGRMGVHDKQEWLEPVKDLLADAVETYLPVLGICLGHQLLADALGGEVASPADAGLEEGPVEITWLPEAADDPVLGRLAGSPVIMPQSHRDAVVRLPEGATELARSTKYPNQAFRIAAALGVQFHPEASPALMGRWARLDGGGAPKESSMRDRMIQVDDKVEPVARAIAQEFARQVRES